MTWFLNKETNYTKFKKVKRDNKIVIFITKLANKLLSSNKTTKGQWDLTLIHLRVLNSFVSLSSHIGKPFQRLECIFLIRGKGWIGVKHFANA